MDYTAHIERAERLRELAKKIRSTRSPTAEIAEGFDLIAGAMEPCTDCGQPALDDVAQDANAEAYAAVDEQVARGL